MTISKTVRISFLLVVLLGGFLVWSLCSIFHPFEPKEPQYQGKKLSDWSAEIDPGVFSGHPLSSSNQEQSNLAISAIRHIGTNALPVAVRLCEAKDSWFKMRLVAWAERYNWSNWPEQRRFPINIKSAAEKNYEGANIIWALGPAAKPIIPDLIRLLENQDQLNEYTVTLLLGAGTNAIPPLVKLLDGANPEVRLRAAIVLGNFFQPKAPVTPNSPLLVAGTEDFRPEVRAAVPVLLQCLDSRNQNLATRIRAIYALGLIHEDASEAVPAIIRHIQSETNNPIMCSDCISALGNFGTNAKPAVPLLVSILESKPDWPSLITLPKASALVALWKIDPEADKPFVEKWKASQTNAPSASALEFFQAPNPPPMSLKNPPGVHTNSPSP
jgi:HEAT repeat protein